MGIFLNKAGAKFKLVDVGGAADRTKALLGAHVDAIPTPLGAAIPYAKSNDYRILAVVGEERNAVYPDVPTAIESGYKGVSFTVYYFFAFPKGTPQAIVSKFAEACRKVSEKPDYQASIRETFQQSPFFMMGEEAVRFLSKQESEIMALSDLFK
jgi:tripartite-type tricarboxylate transporter receptor subunit TctC